VAVVHAEGFGRRYGTFVALRDVSFEVRAGEVVGLLGPNGAGKSTTLAILMGALAPTSGRAEVAGLDVLQAPAEVRRHLGVLPEEPPLYDDMAVEPYLRFMASLRGLGPVVARRGIDRAVEQLGLGDRRGQLIATLSRGFRQRVALAAALLHEPPVVILDEPTAGLDPAQRAEMRQLVRAVGAERTVLLSTHDLTEAQAVCGRVLILSQGRLVADEPVASLQAAGRGRWLRLALGPGPVRIGEAEVVQQVSALPGVERVVAEAPGDDRLRLRVQVDGDRRAELFRWAVDGGHVLVELSERRTDLEQAFLSLTESAATESS